MPDEEPDARERRVADLVADCSDRMNRGESIDVRRLLAENSDLAPDLEAALEAVFDLLEQPGPVARQRFGDFEIVRELGRGGMGVVYEAWQLSVERRVALKVLPPSLAAKDARGLRFAREAKAAGRLSHPSIVPIHAMGVEGGTPYFAMELVEGETLEAILARRRRGERALGEAASRLSTASEIDLAYCLDAAKAFAGVAEGLHHAHAQGVVHRDLKPSNLILDADGRLRILDFGLATIEGDASLTRSGEMLGTPLYMSPEQALGRDVSGAPIDHRADVHALGATLYETLTGEPPFRGRDSADVLHRVVHRDPVPPRRLRPRVPEDLETIVMKCLEKEPRARYATAEALAQDLRRVVRGDPIEARPRAGIERAARFVRRHALAISLVAAFVVLGGALAYFVVDSRTAAVRRRTAAYEPLVREAVMMVQLAQQSFGPRSAAAVGLGVQAAIDVDYLPATATRRVSLVERAVELLSAAAADVPDRPDAYYHRAAALLLLGRDDDALEDVGRALRAAPSFVPARTLRAAVLERRGRSAEAAAERAAALGETAAPWAGPWLAAGAALAERRWTDAAEALSRCVELEAAGGAEPWVGFAVETRLGRGIARLSSGDHDRAIEDFLWARATWPGSLAPALLLARAYFLAEKRALADEVLAEAARDPSRAAEVAAFGTSLMYTFADHERGLAWAQRIPEEAFRERARTVFLADLGRFDEAIAAGDRAVELAPLDAVSHVNLAYACFRAGMSGAAPDVRRLERAYALVLKAIELDPKSPYARTAHGVALAAMATSPFVRPDEAEEARRKAIEALRTALAIDCRIDVAHWELGQLHEAAGDFEAAESAFRAVVEINPFHVDARERLGARLAARGDVAAALRMYAEVLGREPARGERVGPEIDRLLEHASREDVASSSLVSVLAAALDAPRLPPAAAAALTNSLRLASR